jgi:hypothetical protein
VAFGSFKKSSPVKAYFESARRFPLGLEVRTVLMAMKFGDTSERYFGRKGVRWRGVS